ncbi:Probable alphaalpha-trehalose-phosphate synthase [UDP-forming] 9 [Babesia microti strain RI]|uniref:Probable alphaalpha-trehalose-phosphate synthase [UDP-forming] 9 n=1 Tax=Babesia microti (strain RI) TaxID=1133968 RepID=I7J921_BABMR|nr:Probable alphaalpha-trehalose-phosphate synthase [UDP-forming] 9 [Babesia microti strain RI]CCF73134.1 Probable alphaalpha-trehalose-phosphate synthase [UDP-forming] 9 [Babesia microti strain RI]|eukprot:XP_012647743.1 Probable alphaalpha-trehalose-phosphate synthase [UDP-forming] 9 [Babesia microti strain RI]
MITLVTFHAKAAVPEGKSLAIIGDSMALGNNDPQKAYELQPIGTNNIWVSKTPAPLPLRIPVNYKYIVLNGNSYDSETETTCIVAKKETYTVIPNGYEMLVEDDEGEFRNLSTHSTNKSKSDTTISHLEQKRREILDSLNNEKMSHDSTVYFISSRLPVQLIKVLPEGKMVLRERNTPLTTCLWQLRKKLSFPMKYIGFTEVEESHDPNGNLSKLTPFSEGNCIPLEIPEETLSKSDTFNKNFMWTLFYNIGVWDINVQNPFDWELWQAYLEVNKIYARMLVRKLVTGDMIWVHDYKLLMVPHFVTRLRCRANIGIFVHAIFPTFELFKCLAVREELLRSMLCADIIGFHYFESAKHFLTSCRHLLGLDYQFSLYGLATIDYAGRQVIVHMSHPCINSESVLEILRSIDQPNAAVPGCDGENSISELKNYEAKKAKFIHTFCEQFLKDYPQITAESKCLTESFIISSVDREIKLSGILLKMKAFRQFLHNYEYARGKVLLIQHVCFHDTLFGGNVVMLENIQQLATKINNEFQTKESPFHVIVKVGHLSYEDKYSLFKVSDCLMDTCIRGGINLSAFEYIVCRRGKSASAIISEFTGFSHSLETIVRINPWHMEDITRAIDMVMTMPKHTSLSKCDRDFVYINKHDAKSWAESFVREMHWARKKSNHLYLTYGFGKSYKMYTMPSKMIEIHDVMEYYKLSERRLIIVPLETWEDLESKESVVSILGSVAQNTSTQVILLANNYDITIDKDVKGDNPIAVLTNETLLGVISNDGLYYKLPILTGKRWASLIDDVTSDWKGPTFQVMNKYVSRTPGSYIEEKESSLTFHYEKADPDFGIIQAKELAVLLSDLLENLPVQVNRNKGHIQVRLGGVDKGAAVIKIINHYSELFGPFDYILAFGNDAGDETVFDALFKWDSIRHSDGGNDISRSGESHGNNLICQDFELGKNYDSDIGFDRGTHNTTYKNVDFGYTRIVTCKIGKSPSKAKYYIYSEADVVTLLASIADFDGGDFEL